MHVLYSDIWTIPIPLSVSDDFEGFDSRILVFKMVSNMTKRHGRKRSYWALVAVGNGQGLVGLAKAKGTTGQAAVRKVGL